MTTKTGIGAVLPPELRETRDALTGRRIRQFTAGTGHSYPLYYFTPSITLDGQYMVIHRIQDGWLNLWRLDLRDGTMVQLTDGTTPEAGWAIWGEMDVQGVYDHLSTLNRVTREIWYFDGMGLYATHLDTVRQRQVWDLGDRLCISQNDFSPDGRHFLFVHADRRQYQEAVRLHSWDRHEAWRQTVPVEVGVIHVETGTYRTVAQLPIHLHHAVFVDNESFLLNHVPDRLGMWQMRLDGRDLGALRPADGHGSTCHQSVTARGIWYETINWNATPRTWVGRFDLATGTWREFAVPQDGYVHIGHDPAGEAAFYEIDGPSHDLVRVHDPFDQRLRRFEVLCSMAPYPPHTGGQRYHAHPFLGPERDWLYHTRVVGGVSQVAAVQWLSQEETPC